MFLMFWYHKKTKHSYLSVREDPNRLDWASQPSVYKSYPETFQRRKLEREHSEDRFLYEIAGLTAKKHYPGAEYFLRTHPSAGALYPNELYFQAREVEGIKDGIYHYEAGSQSIVFLAGIDENEGIESYLGYRTARRGYLFLVSAICSRSSWKYRNRAFRYCLLDAGHLLGSIEAASLLKPHAVQMIYVLDREKLNRIFGFEGREWFLSAASVSVPIKGCDSDPVEFALPYAEGSGNFESYPLIEKAYRETMHPGNCKREARAPNFSYMPDKLRETILSRRSQRGFGGGSITKGQFNYLLEVLKQPILSDCDEPVSLYAVVNRVIDMPVGLYHEGKYLKYGDFSRKAGYLSLEQYTLSEQSAVTFFLSSNGGNYQALYQKAGIIGHRLYLASDYLGLGCSGIGAYYDDEVNVFLENREMILYALAVGK